MDRTYQYASLAQRVRWAFEALSEVATTLLEMEEADLSAESFDLEIKLAKLHLKLIQPLREARPLPIRKHASRAPADQFPF